MNRTVLENTIVTTRVSGEFTANIFKPARFEDAGSPFQLFSGSDSPVTSVGVCVGVCISGVDGIGTGIVVIRGLTFDCSVLVFSELQ